MKTLFTPFALGKRFSVKFIAGVQLVILLGLWIVAPAETGIPSLTGVITAWNTLATTKGLLVELASSIKVITQALILSALISWVAAVLYTVDLFKPVGTFISALRFLGFAGLTFLFTLWTSSQHGLKLSLLTFGMTVFLTRSMIDIVKLIPQTEIDYIRSLGLHDWRLATEILVQNRRSDMLDLIRQNAAVGWTLLAMVEGITRSEGGIGAMLLNSNKYFGMENVFAIQLTILSYGLMQDQLLLWLRSVLCPWTQFNRSDK